jgi:hypothetical protein
VRAGNFEGPEIPKWSRGPSYYFPAQNPGGFDMPCGHRIQIADPDPIKGSQNRPSTAAVADSAECILYCRLCKFQALFVAGVLVVLCEALADALVSALQLVSQRASVCMCESR